VHDTLKNRRPVDAAGTVDAQNGSWKLLENAPRERVFTQRPPALSLVFDKLRTKKAHHPKEMRPKNCIKNCNHPQWKMGSIGTTRRKKKIEVKLLIVLDIPTRYDSIQIP
jgi:hypothetical protein